MSCLNRQSNCGPWERRCLLKRVPDGYLGSNLNKQTKTAQQPCKLYFRGKPALCFCCLSHPLQKFPGIQLQSIGPRLYPSSGSCIAICPISFFTDQSERLHSNQSGQQCLLDQSNCKNLESSFVWGQTNQGPRETSIYISQLLSGSESGLSLSTHDSVSPARAETMKMSPWSRAKQTSPEKNKSYLRRVGAGPRSLPQPCCITIELFALNKVRYSLHPKLSWHNSVKEVLLETETLKVVILLKVYISTAVYFWNILLKCQTMASHR